MSILSSLQKIAKKSRSPRSVVMTGMVVYVVIIGGAVLAKYWLLSYNALDLAIINQAFYTTAHGQWFASSIQQSSYLGDHFSPFLILLSPLYIFLGQSAVSLLIIQTVALAAAAIPLYLIAQRFLKRDWLAVGVIVAWLLNPIVHNINFYEFSFLSFVPLLGFTAFYYWHRQRYRPFLITILLLLFVREDMALWTFSFGLFVAFDAWRDKKPLPWHWIAPLWAVSIVWFFGALNVISQFNPAAGYKFLIYYRWLGTTPWGVLGGALFHPLRVIGHLITLPNIEMLLGLLLPFVFLPLVRPRYLVMASGTLAVIVLGAPGGGALIFQTHYAAPLLVPLMIAAVAGLPVVLKKYHAHQPFVLLMIGVGVVYSMVMLGVGMPDVHPSLATIRGQRQLLNNIPADASVAATYAFLPTLSSRPDLFSLNYHFIGRQQYSDQPYVIPDTTEYLLIDFSEIATYQLQYGGVAFYQPFLAGSDDRLRQLLLRGNYGVIDQVDTTFLFQKNAGGALSEVTDSAARVGRDSFTCAATATTTLSFSCQAQFATLPTADYQLQLRLLSAKDRLVAERLLPFAYGLQTTSRLAVGHGATMTYQLLWPTKKAATACVDLVENRGGIMINDWRGLTPLVDRQTVIATSCFSLDR